MVFDNSTVTPTNADIAALQNNTTPTIETTSFVGGMNNTSGDGPKLMHSITAQLLPLNPYRLDISSNRLEEVAVVPPLRGSIIKLFILVELDQHQEAEVTLL